MNKSIVILIVSFAACFSFFSKVEARQEIYCGDPRNLQVVTSFETDDCVLTVLKDCTDRQVIAKTIKSPDVEEQALLIVDCCASAIAQVASIPVNQVLLLAYSKPWINCDWYKQLATLHEFAKGCSTKDILPWDGFSLQQRYRVCGSPQWKRWGNLPEEKKGLSRQVIFTMSYNISLAQIAALDTFLGNADRSLPNLYYDKVKDTFFGIDQAASFRRPLAQVAIQQIEVLIKEGFSNKS